MLSFKTLGKHLPDSWWAPVGIQALIRNPHLYLVWRLPAIKVWLEMKAEFATDKVVFSMTFCTGLHSCLVAWKYNLWSNNVYKEKESIFTSAYFSAEILLIMYVFFLCEGRLTYSKRISTRFFSCFEYWIKVEFILYFLFLKYSINYKLFGLLIFPLFCGIHRKWKIR